MQQRGAGNRFEVEVDMEAGRVIFKMGEISAFVFACLQK